MTKACSDALAVVEVRTQEQAWSAGARPLVEGGSLLLKHPLAKVDDLLRTASCLTLDAYHPVICGSTRPHMANALKSRLVELRLIEIDGKQVLPSHSLLPSESLALAENPNTWHHPTSVDFTKFLEAAASPIRHQPTRLIRRSC